mgnify:FL=1
MDLPMRCRMVLEEEVSALVALVVVWVQAASLAAEVVWTVLRQVVAVDASGAVLRRTRA